MNKKLALALTISLLTSIAIFADGNQGNGNRDCSDPNNCPTACTEGCGGGIAPLDATDVPVTSDYVETAVVEVTQQAVELILF